MTGLVIAVLGLIVLPLVWLSVLHDERDLDERARHRALMKEIRKK